MTNVTRGLFRLWIVVSVLWAVGAGGAAWYLYPKPETEWVPGWAREDVPSWTRSEAAGVWQPRKPEDIAKNQREALAVAALAGLLPPIIVLVVGASLVWAVRGFTRRDA
jgi:hypothetical protein